MAKIQKTGLFSMKYLEQTFDRPEDNLACDEALLDATEDADWPEVLRIWEPRCSFVVIGYGNRLATEVNVPACRDQNISILRRCSGGGTVVQGPGCLNYALTLRVNADGPLTGITSTNDHIMQRHRSALTRLLARPVEVAGHTDLAIDGRKFSGNAQRRRQHAVLFHGSFLLNANLELIQALLPQPSRQPEYRAHRAHLDFIINLQLPARCLIDALREAWQAREPLPTVPLDRLTQLTRERYSRPEWNERC
jgi:lipoate-protein ligase A